MQIEGIMYRSRLVLCQRERNVCSDYSHSVEMQCSKLTAWKRIDGHTGFMCALEDGCVISKLRDG